MYAREGTSLTKNFLYFSIRTSLYTMKNKQISMKYFKELEQWCDPYFDYEEWIYVIHTLLLGLELHHHALQKENVVHVLHIPDECMQHILNITQKMGLMVHIHKIQKAIYSGYFIGEKNLYGFQDGPITFKICKPPEDRQVDLSKPVYTFERVM